MFHTTSKGFTLFEVLIVIAIIAVIAGVAIGHFMDAHSVAILRTDVEQIQSVLRLARQRAVSQQGGVEWGVHFTHPSGGMGFYEIFRTASYSPGNVTEQFFLEPRIRFTAPAAGASTTVLFSRRIGTVGATIDIVVSLPSPALTRTIRVLPSGVVETL